MDYVCAVKEVHCAQEVVHDGHHVALRERVVLHPGEDTAQILVVVLHNDEDVVERSVASLPLPLLLSRNHNINQFGSEQIIFHLRKLSQNGDLPNDLARLVTVSENVGDLLDSDHLARLHAPGLDDLAEAAGSNVR